MRFKITLELKLWYGTSKKTKAKIILIIVALNCIQLFFGLDFKTKNIM